MPSSFCAEKERHPACILIGVPKDPKSMVDGHIILFLGNSTYTPRGLLPGLGTGVESAWVQACTT
jgi:hypothetical protein